MATIPGLGIKSWPHFKTNSFVPKSSNAHSLCGVATCLMKFTWPKLIRSSQLLCPFLPNNFFSSWLDYWRVFNNHCKYPCFRTKFNHCSSHFCTCGPITDAIILTCNFQMLKPTIYNSGIINRAITRATEKKGDECQRSPEQFQYDKGQWESSKLYATTLDEILTRLINRLGPKHKSRMVMSIGKGQKRKSRRLMTHTRP